MGIGNKELVAIAVCNEIVLKDNDKSRAQPKHGTNEGPLARRVY